MSAGRLTLKGSPWLWWLTECLTAYKCDPHHNLLSSKSNPRPHAKMSSRLQIDTVLDDNSQCSAISTNLLPPPISRNNCGTGTSPRPDEPMMASRYDSWIRPRPNTQWKSLENRLFIDQGQVISESLDGDGDLPVRKEETDGSSDEFNDGFEEDEIMTRLLELMEGENLHRDSIARLKCLFKSVNLGRLEEGAKRFRSRILLEDRNFSGKSFRPYPRSMTPKQLYNALGKEVRLHMYHSVLKLTIKFRDTLLQARQIVWE